MSCYTSISQFGSGSQGSSNPLTICAVSGLDAGFNNAIGASYLNPQSQQCQAFMGLYCGQNWDGVCEYLSHDTTRYLPNTQQNCNTANSGSSCFGPGLGSASTAGDILVRNAAQEKYLRSMSSNCVRQYEPFDPTTANSPLISKWTAVGGGTCGAGGCDGRGACIPVYGVDARTIDADPVMNKILLRPWIAMDILINIYQNAVRNGEIHGLRNTRLYRMFMSPYFQQIVKGSA